MNDDDMTKLVVQLTKVVATKDDLKSFATKDDLKDLATKDDLKSLATKDDLKKLENKLANEIHSVGETLTKYADELNDKVENHEKRLKKIESIPLIGQNIS